tara:strand:- start:151 stop:924 length:774 start_codon:yes stop_codon:yes gene_type:complete
VVILIIVLSNIFVILEPTERGVIFKKYTSGLDVDDVKQEGLSIVAPWNDVIIFDIAERQIEETMDVLSKDGLSIAIDVSLRFRPEPSKIGYLYRAFKNSYIESLIRPELRSAVRQIIGQYTPEELYATKRQEIETRIQEAIRKVLDENHVELKALLFRSIKLPAMIKTAIEQKLTAEQESEKYEFLIQKEKKEAERRRIDAEGKAAANRILSASITSNILKEKGITATESLAKSNNTKIVVIGGGDDGLPIILNSDK